MKKVIIALGILYASIYCYGQGFVDDFHTLRSDLWDPAQSNKVMHVPKTIMLPSNLNVNSPLEDDPKGENGLIAVVSTKPCTTNPQSCCIDGNCATISGSHMETFTNFSYGSFEIYIRAAHNDTSGSIPTLTCFSTYTNGNEIDACFSGTERTLHCTYFSPDMKQYKYPLTYDPSKEYHVYSFLWQKGSIEWFIDGKSVYKVTGPSQTGGIPWLPQRVVLTFRPLDPNFTGEARIDIAYIKYTPIS